MRWRSRCAVPENTGLSANTRDMASVVRCTWILSFGTTGRRGRGRGGEAGRARALEPMITRGGRHVTELDDGWTVITNDGSRAAHFEHTVAVTAEGPWVAPHRGD